MDVEKQPFLDGHEQDRSIEPDCTQCDRFKATRKGLRFWTLTILSHLFFSFLVLQCVNFAPRIRNLVSVSFAQVQQSKAEILYSPASAALRYEVVTPAADSWEHSEFFETPSHELDQRWANFFKIRGVYFKEDEAARLNMSSLPLYDGKQATVLGVYHNLHCLRTLFQTVHSDYYYPNEDEAMIEGNKVHAHHCLEAIRHSITCNPDLTAYELYWEDKEGLEVAAHTNVQQVCANQDYFWNWMGNRVFMHEELVSASGLTYNA
ncbi:hypothetical protein MMC13_005090 [Lambiella insularis]|nr:hypothetical protein [Lambiella insularis]